MRVVYCAEPFGEDVAPITTIIKHLKRVMAGEYSRELSVKLSRAHHQQAQLGFRQGGKLIYGFRRLLVDPTRNPRQVLNNGERKALSSDKVIVIPGPPEELAVIRRIFRLYVRYQLSGPEIAKRLAKAGIKGYGDKPLGVPTIRHVLSNELCIGQMTYNVTTKRLHGRKRRRGEKGEKKEREGEGYTEGAPSAETVVNHFGSLHAAYAAVGYKPPARPPFGMNGRYWSRKAVLTGLQKLYTAQGRISNRLIDSFPGLPSQVHIRRHFGSVPDAMRQAGLPVLSHSQIQRRAWKRRKAAGCDEYYLGVRWTDAKLLRALHQLQKQYGYISANS